MTGRALLAYALTFVALLAWGLLCTYAIGRVYLGLEDALGPAQASLTYWVALLTLLLCLWDVRRSRRNR